MLFLSYSAWKIRGICIDNSDMYNFRSNIVLVYRFGFMGDLVLWETRITVDDRNVKKYCWEDDELEKLKDLYEERPCLLNI